MYGECSVIQMEFEEGISILTEFTLSMSDSSKEEGEISNFELTKEAEILEEMILGKENQVKEKNIPLTTCTSKKTKPSTSAYEEKGGQLRCLVCNVIFTRMASLKRHWESLHLEYITLFKCIECKVTTLRIEDLMIHGKKKHGWDEDQQEEIKMADTGKTVRNSRYRSPKGRKGPCLPGRKNLQPLVPLATSSPNKTIKPCLPAQKNPPPFIAPSSPVRHIEFNIPPKKKILPVARSPPTQFFPSRLPTRKMLPLPPPPPANLIEARLALKNSMAKRDLAVREVDELQVVTQRFRLRVMEAEKEELNKEKEELTERLSHIVAPGVEEVVKERKRRQAAEQKIQQLMVENRKLKDALQLLL